VSGIPWARSRRDISSNSPSYEGRRRFSALFIAREQRSDANSYVTWFDLAEALAAAAAIAVLRNSRQRFTSAAEPVGSGCSMMRFVARVTSLAQALWRVLAASLAVIARLPSNVVWLFQRGNDGRYRVTSRRARGARFKILSF
jgi:hypothetical protein